jgi:hypothetical protein
MANRIVIGKTTNSNLGYSSSSPGFGIYLARSGKDVLTCTADQLLLNTDRGSAPRIDKGMFQVVPASNGTTTSQTVQVTSGNTGSVNLVNVGSNHVTFVTGGGGGAISRNALSSSTSTTITNPSSYEYNGITQSTSTRTFRVACFKTLSTSALF